MSNTISAKNMTLSDVKQRFGLEEVHDDSFFFEWLEPLPKISDIEQRWLNKLKVDFLSLEQYPLHEELVKMAMLGPLLSLAGLFKAPFYPQAEAEVLFTAEDEGDAVKGRIDMLVVRKRLWITVIESKNKRFSLVEAMPQALTYMMASPNTGLATFGLVTNGTHFAFIKLERDGTPKYAVSDELTLKRRENELYQVLSTLRKLSEVVVEWDESLSA